jgi:hypothetical protein
MDNVITEQFLEKYLPLMNKEIMIKCFENKDYDALRIIFRYDNKAEYLGYVGSHNDLEAVKIFIDEMKAINHNHIFYSIIYGDLESIEKSLLKTDPDFLKSYIQNYHNSYSGYILRKKDMSIIRLLEKYGFNFSRWFDIICALFEIDEASEFIDFYIESGLEFNLNGASLKNAIERKAFNAAKHIMKNYDGNHQIAIEYIDKLMEKCIYTLDLELISCFALISGKMEFYRELNPKSDLLEKIKCKYMRVEQ